MEAIPVHSLTEIFDSEAQQQARLECCQKPFRACSVMGFNMPEDVRNFGVVSSAKTFRFALELPKISWIESFISSIRKMFSGNRTYSARIAYRDEEENDNDSVSKLDFC